MSILLMLTYLNHSHDVWIVKKTIFELFVTLLLPRKLPLPPIQQLLWNKRA